MNEITTLINMELNGEAVSKKETIKRLKPLVNKDTIALAQVDPVVCDIEHNFNKAKIYIDPVTEDDYFGRHESDFSNAWFFDMHDSSVKVNPNRTTIENL